MTAPSLKTLVTDFAEGVAAVDATSPVAVNQRSGAAFQPGIGPHTEALTVKLVMLRLATSHPERPKAEVARLTTAVPV